MFLLFCLFVLPCWILVPWLGVEPMSPALEAKSPNIWELPTTVLSCGSMVKNPPAKQGTRVLSLGWEYTLEKKMVTHSSDLIWKIPWREEPGRLQSMGSYRVRHDLVTNNKELNCRWPLTFSGHLINIYWFQIRNFCLLEPIHFKLRFQIFSTSP